VIKKMEKIQIKVATDAQTPNSKEAKTESHEKLQVLKIHPD